MDPIEDFHMEVNLFAEVDSPCIANQNIRKTATGQFDSFDQISIKIIENNFYMDNFFSSFYETSNTIKVCIDVINILEKGVFRLTKFV